MLSPSFEQHSMFHIFLPDSRDIETVAKAIKSTTDFLRAALGQGHNNSCVALYQK